MKSFYSLIKIAPNEMSGDSLTIGIILSNQNVLKVKFSKAKKQISKSILSSSASFVDFVEKEIQIKVREQNKLALESKGELFDFQPHLDANYFNYLSKYSNGLLKFSSPTLIAESIDDSMFEKLFRLLVDSTISDEKERNETKKIERIFYEKVDTRLISKVKDTVHINQTFDRKMVPTLFNTFQLECVGLNGTLIGAKALPFTQSRETLQKSVNTYISVIAHLTSKYKKSLDANNFYLIADQPKKTTSEYKFWRQLYKDETLLKVISSDESDQVAELIDKKNAGKFLDL